MSILKYVIAVTSILSSTSWAKDYSCRLNTGDVGEISVRAESQKGAKAAARETCVDRREQLFVAQRGQPVSESRYADFIDSCINLECSKN